MTESIGLRDKKKARIKLRILAVVLELVHEKSFDEIFVEEICSRVEISKVTFFKYFSQKEDILAFFMRVWCYQRTVERSCLPFHGLSAIDHLFREATRESERYAKARLLPISLVAYLAKRQHRPEMADLEEAEKMLLYPDRPNHWEISLETLEQLLLGHLREAVALGELGPDRDLIRLAKHLVSIFYGAPISALILQENDLASYYRAHVADLFGKKD